MRNDVARRVRALGAHPLSPPSTAASVGAKIRALRRVLHHRVVGLPYAVCWHTPTWRGEGSGGGWKAAERPERGGPVASGPAAGRMQAEAVGGGDLAARDGRVHVGGVDRRFRRFSANPMFRRCTVLV